MTEWMTLFGVLIAAGATMAVQLLINRGEPAALRRITLLNEAIAGIHDDDEAKRALLGARSKLVAQTATSLAGFRGVARWLRIGAWTSLAAGTGVLVLCVIAMIATGPSAEWWAGGFQGAQIGLLLLILAPILLIYSAMWPGIAADVLGVARWAADRKRTRGYGKIREALTVELPDERRTSRSDPAVATG